MSETLSLLGALLVILAAAGWGSALLHAWGPVERTAGEAAALALGLGLCAHMVFVTVLAGLGIPLLPALSMGWCVLGIAAGAWTLRASRADRARHAGASEVWRLPASLRVLLLVLGLGSVLAVVALPLHTFDPIFHYAFKGKLLAAGSIPGDLRWTGMLDEGGRRVSVGPFLTHPDYPIGVPALMALTAQFGGWSDRWVQLPVACFAALLPWFVAVGLRPAGRAAASWGAAIAAACPVLYVRDLLDEPLGEALGPMRGLTESDVLHSLVDPGVACLAALGLALWLRARVRGRAGPGFLAGLAWAGAALVKNEGLALAAIGGGAALLVSLGPVLRRGPGARPLFGLAVGLLLCLLPWLVVRSSLPAIDENYGERLRPAAIAESWSAPERVDQARDRLLRQSEEERAAAPLRRAEVGRLLATAFFDVQNFGLLWPLVVLLAPLAFRRARAPSALLVMVIACGWTLYALVLLVSPWYLPDLTELGIPERLLLHLLGPAAMLAGLGLARPVEPASET